MTRKIVTALMAVGIIASLANADVVSKNGIAKDSVTGLMWQDDDEIASIKKDWDGAKQYCQDLRLGDYNDWRLANIYELITLLNESKKQYPFVVNGFKNNFPDSIYWSSTDSTDINRALIITFDNSTMGYDYYKPNSGYFKCARGVQLNFNALLLLKKRGQIHVSQKNIDNISPTIVDKWKKRDEIANKKQIEKEAKEQADRDRQAEYNRKHQCDGFYPGKNFKVHTTGLFGGDEKARVNGVDKDGGQVSFEWYDGNSWRAEEASCSYLKTQMR